jgi:hypothetical protein
MADRKVIDAWRTAGLCLAGFGLISPLGCAAPQPPPASMTPATSGFTLDTPIEVIAADPAGQAVLNKDMPGLMTNPNYHLFKGMSLKALASASGGMVSQQTLAQTLADLAALPKRGMANP